MKRKHLFAARSNETELMDDLNSGGEEMRKTLRELAVINSFLGGNRVTLNAIKQLIDFNEDKVWRILDIGCGDGDILKLIAKWARRKSVKVDLVGIDANPNIIHFAEENCKGLSPASHIRGETPIRRRAVRSLKGQSPYNAD